MSDFFPKLWALCRFHCQCSVVPVFSYSHVKTPFLGSQWKVNQREQSVLSVDSLVDPAQLQSKTEELTSNVKWEFDREGGSSRNGKRK